MDTEEQVGNVRHFFSKIMVAVLDLTGTVKVGDTIHFKGDSTDFIQKISSMQMEHTPMAEAHASQSIGLKVEKVVKEQDKVFKI